MRDIIFNVLVIVGAIFVGFILWVAFESIKNSIFNHDGENKKKSP